MGKAKKPPKQEQPLNELEVLFAEEQVGPYTLRPWTLQQFAQLVVVLTGLVGNFVGQGVDQDNVDDFLKNSIDNLLPLVTPIVPQVIAVTLRLPPEEVEQIEPGTQLALGLRILLNKQNQRQLKNFYAGLLGNKSPAQPTT